MEILQGAVNRDDYYSVKDCAGILGVTTKTIRNRIDDKKLHAVWNEIGKGQSQWLIPKEVIRAIVDKEVSNSRQISIPNNSMDEIKAQIRAENEAIRQELAEMRMAQQEIAFTQARIEKSLLERDEKLIGVIRERMEEQQEKSRYWWKFWA